MSRDIVSQFEALYSEHSDTQVEDRRFQWHNTFYHGPLFKWAHIEHYHTNPKIEVFHTVVMPWIWQGIPIFGLDLVMIAGNVTMICADFTPTEDRNQEWALDRLPHPHRFEAFQDLEPRDTPEWAHFFSDECLFLHTPESTEQAFDIVQSVYLDRLDRQYFGLLEEIQQNPARQLNFMGHWEGQQAYVENQRKNDKTFKSLKADVGEKEATFFMRNVLFPDVPLTIEELEKATTIRHARRERLTHRLVSKAVQKQDAIQPASTLFTNLSDKTHV